MSDTKSDTRPDTNSRIMTDTRNGTVNGAVSDPVIGITRLAHFDGLDLPRYASDGAAGMDIQAACTENMTMEPRQRLKVPTGLKMAIPQGYEVQIRPRSGLAINDGVTVANAPGTIDSDYRGEVMVCLHHQPRHAHRPNGDSACFAHPFQNHGRPG